MLIYLSALERRKFVALLAGLFFFIVPLSAQSEEDILFSSAKNRIPDDLRGADSLVELLLKRLDQEEFASDSFLAKANYLKGIINYYQGWNTLASNYYKRALETRHAEQNLSFAEANWNNLGVIYDKQSRLNEALNAYYASLRIAEKLGDSSSIVKTWINIALLDGKKENNERAIQITQSALNYAARHKDSMSMGLCYQNLGMFYRNKSEVNAAESRALAIFRSINAYANMASLLISMGSEQIDSENFRLANQYLEEALSLGIKYGMTDSQGAAYYLLGYSHVLSGSGLELVPGYLNKSLEIIHSTGRRENLSEVWAAYAAYYAQIGDFPNYLKAFQKYKDYRAENTGEATTAEYSEMQTLYEVEQLNLEKEQLRLDSERKRTTLIILLSALIIVLIAVAGIAVLYLRLKNNMRTLYQMNLAVANSVPVFHLDPSVTVTDRKEGEEDIPLTSLYNAIVRKIEQEKLFLNPGFSMDDLSAVMNKSRRYLSQAISSGGKTNFAGLVNGLRVNEARRLLASSAGSLTMNEIAEKSGFANRISFYRQFKEITGFTPTAYLEWSQNPAMQELEKEEE